MDIVIEGGVIRIEQKEYPEGTGQHFVDVRRWFDVDGMLTPTKKGFMVPLHNWVEFADGVAGFRII